MTLRRPPTCIPLSTRQVRPDVKRTHVCIGILAMALSAACPAATQTARPANDADRQAIETLLDNYTRCVTQNDEAGFEAQLLAPDIPFSSVSTSRASVPLPDLHRYADFRKAVFQSGQRFKQRFYNVHIERQGPLAQVSLDFTTEQISGKPQSATGWKVLQLIKVAGQWKIASELFTFER
jgi:hypothetical protein